jgi:hypothetical protein
MSSPSRAAILRGVGSAIGEVLPEDHRGRARRDGTGVRDRFGITLIERERPEGNAVAARETGDGADIAIHLRPDQRQAGPTAFQQPAPPGGKDGDDDV